MGKKKKGTDGHDTFEGTDKNDKYDGLGGPDAILGYGGNDKLWGGGDADTIQGGKGNDKIWGGDDHDSLAGNEGKDIIWGGSGADAFLFSRGGPASSDVDIIKDLETSGPEMDFIYLMNFDPFDIIVTLDHLLDFASQKGKHVELDFGKGDKLILENTKISELSDELFGF